MMVRTGQTGGCLACDTARLSQIAWLSVHVADFYTHLGRADSAEVGLSFALPRKACGRNIVAEGAAGIGWRRSLGKAGKRLRFVISSGAVAQSRNLAAR